MKDTRRFFPLTGEIEDPFTEEDWKISSERLERLLDSEVVKLEWDHS